MQSVLTEEDIEICQQAFNDLDEVSFIVQKNNYGEIQIEDLEIALELVKCKQRPHKVNKIISEFDTNNKGVITFTQFLKIYERIKYASQNDDGQDMIDAFVAMGGDEDMGGHVDADVLRRIIKNEFELTIDIDKLIQEVDEDGSGVIEFGEFVQLLSTNLLVDKDEVEF